MRKQKYRKQLFDEESAQQSEQTAEPAREERMYSAEEVDAMIAKRFERWQKQQQKAVDEAARLAAMTEQERTAHERDELQAKVEEYERRDARASMERTARQMLADKGISGIGDALIATLVTEDAEGTTASVEAFAQAYTAAVAAGIAAQMPQAPKAGAASTGITKEDIAKVQNRQERQCLMREHLDLYQ